MSTSASTLEWLQGYASTLYDWQTATRDGRKIYWRRMGVVEGLFDVDGTDFEGRADLNINLRVLVRTFLDTTSFRRHLVKAWCVLRQQHAFLSTARINVGDIDSNLTQAQDRAFVFKPSRSSSELLREGWRHLVFVGDDYPNASPDDFYEHVANSSRAISASDALSKLYVLPFQHSTSSIFTVHFMLVAAHQIVDGLTTFAWMNSFIDILNLSGAELDLRAKQLCSQSPSSRLPPAQESLYPALQGSPAQQRWIWAITRILRHVKTTTPASFANPLYRNQRVERAVTFPPKYDKVLDYTRTPPLNNYHISAGLSPTSTARLRRLCRGAGISIGSGLFTLVAITMMAFHEERCPKIPLQDRLPFVCSFPVNPRPFLTGTPTAGKEDSLMLAFSDGITLPFLPGDLTFEGRFKLLGKQAHRQLKQYQKRKPTKQEELNLGTASGAQLLRNLYLSTADRLEQRRNPEDKRGWNVQGHYPAKLPKTPATCGISSVGDRSSLIRRGKYDTSNLPEGRDVMVDFKELLSTVRARGGEFLVGAVGEEDWFGFGVSYDGCAVDPERVGKWKEMIVGMLEVGGIGGEKKVQEERARL